MAKTTKRNVVYSIELYYRFDRSINDAFSISSDGDDLTVVSYLARQATVTQYANHSRAVSIIIIVSRYYTDA